MKVSPKAEQGARLCISLKGGMDGKAAGGVAGDWVALSGLDSTVKAA